ncbi:MAG: 5'-nucleotidase C-terminal domain-containing protein [Chitinophagales bacterium]|nr:5'-nucleotidase C-terminal domain-containing protein [Chitinophagales bacterium]
MLHFTRNIALLFLLFTVSCAQQLTPVQYSYQRKNIDSNSVADAKIESMIKPYKDSLQATMNAVIVTNNNMLTKKQPESTLGNVLADALLQQASKCCGKKADVAILNQGGIRLSQLAPGPVTLGKIYELMPFENRLVLMELSGKDLQLLFNSIAHAGGWPISGARFTISNNSAENVTINGKALDADKMYWLAVSDYLADGGDKLEMIKGKPYIDSGKTIRQAFIDEFTEMNAQGKQLKAYLDKRIEN